MQHSLYAIKNKTETADSPAASFQPSVKYLKKLFDSLTELICVIDKEGRFVYINKASLPLLGYRPEELIATSCYDLMIEEDKEQSLQAVKSALSGTQQYDFENHYYKKDGGIV